MARADWRGVGARDSAGIDDDQSDGSIWDSARGTCGYPSTSLGRLWVFVPLRRVPTSKRRVREAESTIPCNTCVAHALHTTLSVYQNTNVRKTCKKKRNGAHALWEKRMCALWVPTYLLRARCECKGPRVGATRVFFSHAAFSHTKTRGNVCAHPKRPKGMCMGGRDRPECVFPCMFTRTQKCAHQLVK